MYFTISTVLVGVLLLPCFQEMLAKQNSYPKGASNRLAATKENRVKSRDALVLKIQEYTPKNDFEESLLAEVEGIKRSLGQDLRNLYHTMNKQTERLDNIEREVLDNVGEVTVTPKAWFMFRVYRDRIRKARSVLSNLNYALNRPVSFVHDVNDEPVETRTDMEVALMQVLEQLRQNMKLMGTFGRDRVKILRLMRQLSLGAKKSLQFDDKLNQCIDLLNQVSQIEESVRAVLDEQSKLTASESWNKMVVVSPQELFDKISSVSGTGADTAAAAFGDPLCLNISQEWRRCGFVYDGSWTDCHGSQYVRLSGYQVGRFVGVVTCGHQRDGKYKIFLGDSLSSKFLAIADLNGKGEDHCEFVGANSNTAVNYSRFYRPGTFEGYLRRIWGEQPVRRTLNGHTGHFSPKWYECGVTIPL